MSRLQVPKMYKLFIGGKFTRTESERYITIKKSKDRDIICNVSRASRNDLRNAVVAARNAFAQWNDKTAYERGQIFYRLAEMLEGRKAQFISEIVINTGISKIKATKEVETSIDRIVWFAGFSDKWMQLAGSINPVQKGYYNFSIPEPTGVVGILLPEEPSLLGLISRLCPVIVSGNTCIIIASQRYPLPALTFSEVIATSDFPAGVINILTGLKKELVPYLASHLDVNAFDYADIDTAYMKDVKIACANNIKRFAYSYNNSIKDFYDNNLNENLTEILSFTEIKTVWHTKGL